MGRTYQALTVAMHNAIISRGDMSVVISQKNNFPREYIGLCHEPYFQADIAIASDIRKMADFKAYFALYGTFS